MNKIVFNWKTSVIAAAVFIFFSLTILACGDLNDNYSDVKDHSNELIGNCDEFCDNCGELCDNCDGFNDINFTLNAPRNIKINDFFLSWDNDYRSMDSDLRVEASVVYIMHPSSQEFIFVSLAYPCRLWHCCGIMNSIDYDDLDLRLGKNTIKIYSVAGLKEQQDEKFIYSKRSAEVITIIDVNIITEEQIAQPSTEFSITNNLLNMEFGVKVYFRHHDEDEYIRIMSDSQQGRFLGTLPELRLGKNMLKVIRLGNKARLDGTTLINLTDSEPVFIPLNITGFETRQLPSPLTNLRVSGSGTTVSLHWNSSANTWVLISVKQPGDDDFGHPTSTFQNSIQLNRLNFSLGNNVIRLMSPGGGRTVFEEPLMVTYLPVYDIYNFIVHREQKVATPSNFRIEVIHGNISLTWDRDPITNGNSISDNNTLIEIKNPGQDEFINAGRSGIILNINLQPGRNSWLHYGENIVRFRIATQNISILDGIVTRYIPSDFGYVVLYRDFQDNISIK